MKRYPKIPNFEGLSGRYDTIFSVPSVRIEEKYHGTQFRIFIDDDGKLLFGSRRQMLTPTGNVRSEKLGNPFYQGRPLKAALKYFPIVEISNLEDRFEHYKLNFTFMQTIEHSPLFAKLDLKFPLTFFGEFVGRGVQGGVDYGEDEWYLFDVYDHEHETYVDYKTLEELAHFFNMPLVPILALYSKPTPTLFQECLDRPTLLEKNGKKEGIVIKADPPKRDRYEDWIVCKIKSEEFKEKIKVPKKKKVINPKAREQAEMFASQVITLGRLRNVVDRLKQQNLWTGDETSMRDLISGTFKDLREDSEIAGMWQNLKEQHITDKFISKCCVDQIKVILDYHPMNLF